MKIVVDSQLVLSIPLSKMSNAVNLKPIIPELSCVLIAAEKGELWCYTTTGTIDLHMPIKLDGVRIESEGRALVSYQLLSAALSSIPGEIALFTGPKGLTIQSQQDKRRYRKLPLADPENLPDIPDVAGKPTIIDGPILKDAINCVHIALPKRESRPELLGVYVGNSTFCGDGSRIIRYNLDNDLEVTIPASSIGALTKLLPSEGNVELREQDSWLQFTMPTGAILKLLRPSVSFPANVGNIVDQLTRQSPATEIITDKKELERILNGIQVYVEKAVNYGVSYVTFTGDSSDVLATISVAGLGTFEDVLECTYKGTAFELLLSPTCLLDIARIASGELKFSIFSNSQPILVQEVDNDKWVVVQSVMGTRATIQDDEGDF